MNKLFNKSSIIKKLPSIIILLLLLFSSSGSLYFAFFVLVPNSTNNNFNLAEEIVESSKNDEKNLPIGILSVDNTSTFFYRYNDIQSGSVRKLQKEFDDIYFLKSYLNNQTNSVEYYNPINSFKTKINLISTQTSSDDETSDNELYPNIQLISGQENVNYFPLADEIYVSISYANSYFESQGIDDYDYDNIIGEHISLFFNHDIEKTYIINGVFNPSSQGKIKNFANAIGDYFIIRTEDSILSQSSMIFTTSKYFFEMKEILDKIDKTFIDSSLNEQRFEYSFYQYENDSFTLDSSLNDYCHDMYLYDDQLIRLYFEIVFGLASFTLFICFFIICYYLKNLLPNWFSKHTLISLFGTVLIGFFISIFIAYFKNNTGLLGAYVAKLITPFNFIPVIIYIIMFFIGALIFNKKKYLNIN